MRRGKNIEGWMMPGAAALLGLLDDVQNSAAVHGHLFEIGVHHGKSAVLLCAMARADEQVGVCDLFGQQDRNASDSGSGDRLVFEANLRRVVPGFSFNRLHVFAVSSDELTSECVSKPQRIFHVDGGHLREEALADLRLAAEVMHELGAIVVDDPFRPEWPGVTEAIIQFVGGRSGFVPLILGFNKIVLVHQEARALYEPMVDESELFWSYFDKRVVSTKVLPVAGVPTRIIYVPSWLQRPELERALVRALTLRARAVPGIRRRLEGLRAYGSQRIRADCPRD